MPDRPTLTSLKPLFTFPFRDKWQNRFLIGVLIIFASFAIPILPGILLLGYTLRITRQAIHDQELHLPAWDAWGHLALDGLRASVVYLVYLLPGGVVMLGGSAVYFASTIALPLTAATTADADSTLPLVMPLVLLVSMGIMFLSMFLGNILSVLGVIPLPIATARFADKDQVAAAFKLRALWAIFRANVWGYLVAWTIVIGLFGMLYIAFMIAYMSIVLCCLIPIVVAPIAFYLSTVSAAVFGRAYRESQLALENTRPE